VNVSVEFIVAFVVVLFSLCLITDPLGRLLRVPHTVLLVVTGAAGAHIVTRGLGYDLGLRATSFHDLVFYVFLPMLVFESAYHIPIRALTKNLGVILFLAVVGMLLTAVVSAALIYWAIGHGSGFPWIAALLTGALLASTDPVAVVAQLKDMGAPARLSMLLEGESLFNDATAIVLFGMFLTLATMPAVEASVTGAATEFVIVFFGGLGFGIVIGLVGAGAIRVLRGGASHALVTLTLAYGSYLIADVLLNVSGIMATLAAGLVLARAVQREDARITGTEVGFTLRVLAYAANGSVFLLVGMTLTAPMFTERWLAMLIAVGAVLLARMVVIFGGLPLINLAVRDPVPLRYGAVMSWGGLRGAVTLALALALPTTLEYWWTIQAMAYGVVLFTLFVQAPTVPPLIRRSGLG
jgi:CPA1 family monovalent cation:H+ antiporter